MNNALPEYHASLIAQDTNAVASSTCAFMQEHTPLLAAGICNGMKRHDMQQCTPATRIQNGIFRK